MNRDPSDGRASPLQSPPSARASDAALDRLARFASRLFAVPMVSISVVEPTRVWFEGRCGVDLLTHPRGIGWCERVLQSRSPLYLGSLEASHSPLRIREEEETFGLGFVAGVPLSSPNGIAIGALSLLDRSPRDFAAGELTSLAEIAALASDRLAALHRERDMEQLARDETKRRTSLASIVDQAPVALFLTDAEGLCRRVNEWFAELVGTTEAQIVRHPWWHGAHPDDVDRLKRIHRSAVHAGSTVNCEYRVIRASGVHWLRARLQAEPRPPHGAGGLVGTVADVTENRRAGGGGWSIDSKSLHAQRMQTLGVSVAGIAHDFNNLLVAILGNASELRETTPLGADGDELLGQIELAGERAADFCSQLLAYAGRGNVVIRPVELNQMVREMTRVLDAVVSTRCEIDLDLAPSLPLVLVDSTQMRQVVMNLIINASEAHDGGVAVVTVSTGLVWVDRKLIEKSLIGSDLQEGEFVFVEVSDAGSGIDRATIDRIFDPFFTTKKKGRGLGLAAVRDIVQAHGGAMIVESSAGQGTRFRVLMPRCTPELVGPSHADLLVSRSEEDRILFVSDDLSMSSQAHRIVERAGFDVVAIEGSELPTASPVTSLFAGVVFDLTARDVKQVLAWIDRVRTWAPDHTLLVVGEIENREIAEAIRIRGASLVQRPFRTSQLREELLGVLRKGDRLRSRDAESRF